MSTFDPPTRLRPTPAGAPLPEARGRRVLRFAGRELAIWASLYLAYLAVRGMTIGAPAEAMRHGADVARFERTLGVFHEGALQERLAPVVDVFSAYYMLGFGPLLGVVLAWLASRHRETYRELRTALLLSIALATVVFVVFPTAPPRLVTGLRIHDTVGLSGHDSGSFMGIRFNPYAAVPSMHVGWSALVALFGFRATRRRALKAFFAVHPLLMAVTVSGTGNHFFLDSAAGLTVAGLALLILRLVHRRPGKPRLVLVSPPAELPAPASERRAA